MTTTEYREKPFINWLADAKPRDRYLYHFGPFVQQGRRIDEIRTAYNRGHITLVQKRNGVGQFDFYAVKLELPALVTDPFIIEAH